MSDLIVLCPNPFRDTGLELTLQAKALLETNGYRTEICPVSVPMTPKRYRQR